MKAKTILYIYMKSLIGEENWKHGDKIENLLCSSWWAISPFGKMFSKVTAAYGSKFLPLHCRLTNKFHSYVIVHCVLFCFQQFYSNIIVNGVLLIFQMFYITAHCFFMPPESPIRWASSFWPVCLSKITLTLTTSFEP